MFLTKIVEKESKKGRRVIKVKKNNKVAKSMREEKLFDVPIKVG